MRNDRFGEMGVGGGEEEKVEEVKGKYEECTRVRGKWLKRGDRGGVIDLGPSLWRRRFLSSRWTKGRPAGSMTADRLRSPRGHTKGS